MSVFYQISLIRPGSITPRAFDFLTEMVLENQISAAANRIGNPDTGDWRLTWLVSTPVDLVDTIATIALGAEIAGLSDEIRITTTDLTIEEIPADDWLERSYRGFPPFTIGRFYLYGQHHTANVQIPDGQIPLLIDAVTAFGSGEHPTTKGCLLILDDLAQAGHTPNKILDHGTGSGILAIAAYKLWGKQVIAADIDPESVRVAAEYRDYNHVPADMMPTYEGASPADPEIAGHGPYDLLIANILAGPLRELAPDMAAMTTSTGLLVLSGLLETQMDEVISAYIPHGFTLADHKIIGDWAALLLKRG